MAVHTHHVTVSSSGFGAFLRLLVSDLIPSHPGSTRCWSATAYSPDASLLISQLTFTEGLSTIRHVWTRRIARSNQSYRVGNFDPPSSLVTETGYRISETIRQRIMG
uniref:Uncharacterized protein n=1 Tax=Schistocephalus solidus TaxID=70667 RepID=A0A0V0J9R2_SCHSO